MNDEDGQLWNILFIADSEVDYHRIRAMLEETKDHLFQMKWLRVAAEIAGYACDPQYDAVLIEYRFDVTRGMELLDEIEKQCPEAPILLLVGWVPAEIQEIAREHGAYAFLDKTQLDSAALKDAIQAVIDKKAL